jgi:ribosomal protein S27E
MEKTTKAFFTKIGKHLSRAKDRCKGKSKNNLYYARHGITFDLSREEAAFIWMRDGAQFMKKPVLHRNNTKNGYASNNCSFVEFEDHKFHWRLGKTPDQIKAIEESRKIKSDITHRCPDCASTNTHFRKRPQNCICQNCGFVFEALTENEWRITRLNKNTTGGAKCLPRKEQNRRF